jgi:hypothetical protein
LLAVVVAVEEPVAVDLVAQVEVAQEVVVVLEQLAQQIPVVAVAVVLMQQDQLAVLEVLVLFIL